MGEINSKPVIILAFANDKDAYLDMIVRERKNIFEALQQHDDKGYIQVHKEENTSIEDIFDLFNRYSDRIAIFHYGGHASGTHLQLESGAGKAEMAGAKGLAQLMGQHNALQLVFLNGCATQDQVKILFDSGVKVVIATSVPINDEMATEFAGQFYNALAVQAPIQKAFQTAKAFVTAKYSGKIDVGEFRGMSWEGKRESASTAVPWGLYVNSNGDEALEWKLPDVKRMVDIGVTASGGGAAQVNTMLIEMLSKELPKHSRKMAQFVEALENNEEDDRELPVAIMDSFPLPVGIQLRKLFSSDMSLLNVQRLQQLVVTYETIVRLLCFAILSELWEQRYRDPKLSISSTHQKVLEEYFALDGTSHQTFDYVGLMAAVVEVLRENSLVPFVEELRNLPEMLQQEDFRQAHLFLEDMRARDKKVAAEEIEHFCVQSEKSLGTIMACFAFIVKYKLTSIKEIKIIKHRHKEPKYEHREALLTRTTGQDVMRDTEKEYESFAECQSVILVKSAKDLNQFLNLSPFMLDENALTNNENSKLFFYSFRETTDDSYHFRFINDEKDALIISENRYPKIKKEFEQFRKGVLGK